MTTTEPTNVVQALARVMAEIGGIDKLTAADRARRGIGGGDQGIGYPYRGIDQIAAKAQPLLGRYGVVVVPAAVESTVREFTINNRPWTDTYSRITWSIRGPGGPDDQIIATTEGLGRDNSDKGYNKASTAAYKNLLLRLLCIGDPKDDTDGHTHERDAEPASRPVPVKPRSDAERAIRGMLDTVDPDVRQRVQTAFRDRYTFGLADLPVEQHDDALTWVTNALAVELGDADDRADADAAHAAAEQPDPVTPTREDQP